MRSTVSKMSESDWQVRPLALEDCEELGRVHMAVWRETYAGLMPADYLAGQRAMALLRAKGEPA